MRQVLVAVLVALMFCGAAVAQVQPVVRVAVTPATVAVGEPVRMRVTVLVPTWFSRPPVFPSFELANAITRLPPDSSFPTSERVGGETWSGIVRDYRVYPLLGATYRLAGQAISVAYANPGSDDVVQNVAVEEIVIRSTVPDGAESLDPYIAGSSLQLTLTIAGDLDDLEVGDAIVLNYSAELEGLPAIFLPPLAPHIDVPGIAVYADEPNVEDGAIATRSEIITLVFEAGGDFVVPSVQLDYWNTRSGEIATVVADGLTIPVRGPQVTAVDGDAGVMSSDWRAAILPGLLALVFAFVLRRALPGVLRQARAAMQRRRQSEAYAFRELQAALRSGSSREAYCALLTWLGRLVPAVDARSFAERVADPELLAAVDALSKSMYSSQAVAPDQRRLAARLAAGRDRYRKGAGMTAQTVLPPLNP